MRDEPPTRAVAAAYVLAGICMLLPLALVGAAFAGAALITHGRPVDGAGVIVVAVACTAFGVAVLR